MIASQRDPWGNSVIYEPHFEDGDADSGEEDLEGFSVRSLGQDKLADTEDDMIVGPFYDVETAVEQTRGFDEVLEEGFENIEAEMKKQAEEAEMEQAERAAEMEEGSSDPILDFGDDN